MTHRRSMRCRFGVGEGVVGKAQRIVDLTKNPRRKGVENLRCGASILAEPVGEISMARLVVEVDDLLKMVASADKVAEIKAGHAGNAMRDQGLGTVRPGRGFVPEKLGHFAHRCGFAAVQMPCPKTVIGRKPFGGVFHPVREFTGAGKGCGGLRRVISLGPDQRIAEARL